ncbi:TPA: hypothetical protein N0F65_010777 [Lagenidium giganteum]|uniref:Ion transport domain-containing protein n=1 Tax=Lagenidium giganteum TaxID=4803 RepID=A0AAV2YVS5_9STRA|nr:TPA: hypothetical protein N0F65_010777 [Lagenidium giganteum]
MNDDKLYDRVQVTSAQSESFGDADDNHHALSYDESGRMGLSPRRARAKSPKPSHIVDLASPDLEPVRGDDGYDSDANMGADTPSHADDRFRVNGIVVDQEVRGGPKPNWRFVYEILFQSSTPTGQKMALTMLIMVSLSVTIAVLDSVKAIQDQVGDFLLGFEIFFTIVFSIEYILRVLCLRKPRKFVFSVIGMIDLCAIVPTYLGFLIPTARPLVHLAVLRIFRVLRVFRVLRLARFVDAASALSDNIQANKRRIMVFLVALGTMILVIGCAMYLIEGDRHGFSNIPVSLYWTVVTITTVGYGDIAPETIPGRMLATVVMFAGYGIIACPLILNHTGTHDVLTEVIDCPRCFRRFHQEDANFCRVCGASLREPRAKTIKATRERLRKTLKHPSSVRLPTPGALSVSSTTSTSKSTACLLADDTMRLDQEPRSRTAL